MSIRATLLCAAAALVAVGGIYLLVQVKSSGATAPSGTVLAEAADRHARNAPPSNGTRPPRRDDTPSIPKPDKAPGLKSRFAAPPGPFDLAVVRNPVDPPAESGSIDAEAEFEQAMSETNKLYDRQQFDDARTLALRLLERKPGTVRMMRVVVSSSCILGDAETAQKYWTELPEFDRAQMVTRCERFDIKFK